MEARLFDAVTGVGIIAKLEQKFKQLVGVRFAVAMSNCTSALDAALLACGVKSGDEVIVPAFTWGGSISGILQRKAIPVFADIDETLTLDPDDAERRITHKTKAITAVHLFGNPCDMDKLSVICQKHGLALIEDCAQAIGAKIQGRHVGTFGAGCFSFGYGKPLSAGEGGILTTNDENIFDRVLYYSQHPLRQRKDMISLCEPNEFSVNYRLSPIAAKAVLEGFDDGIAALEEKRKFFQSLQQKIAQSSIDCLIPPVIRKRAGHSWYRFSISIDSSVSEQTMNHIKIFLAENGCQLESGYIPRPLYHHHALTTYLCRRAAKNLKLVYLPKTESACRIQAGVTRLLAFEYQMQTVGYERIEPADLILC